MAGRPGQGERKKLKHTKGSGTKAKQAKGSELERELKGLSVIDFENM